MTTTSAIILVRELFYEDCSFVSKVNDTEKDSVSSNEAHSALPKRKNSGQFMSMKFRCFHGEFYMECRQI